MRIRHATALIASLIFAGCSGSSDSIGPTDPTSGNGNPATPPAGVGSFKALFVAASGVLPYPTDLYFNGSTDGTLNISSSTLFPQRVVMNQLDGFSTTASSYFRMSQPVRDDAVMLNSSVRIIRAPMLRQPSGVYAPVGVLGVLTPGLDYSVRVAPEIDAGGATVEIVWLKPLAASTGQGLGTGYIVTAGEHGTPFLNSRLLAKIDETPDVAVSLELMRRWNAHDELVAACNAALIRLEGNTGVDVLSQQETADIVRAALAKAKAVTT